ncbi:MAG: AtpZ/AtpI family protein [Acholeplasmataceae bacterium]|jgi:VIT1/CCC1 family predicted Fe2+/Mn2+ transporter|nr:AtpZ/AtpI family protein [Acholeplasmataceae bacterium]
MNYMMVMQFIVTAIALALFGYYLGNRINKESNLSTVLTAVGLGLGVMIGFITVIYMIKSEERYERSTRH